MTEILEIANRLGGASFATLLLIILWSNWKGYWCWTSDRDRAVEALKADREDWKKTALQALGGFEKSNDYAVRIAAAASPSVGLAAISRGQSAGPSPPDGSNR